MAELYSTLLLMPEKVSPRSSPQTQLPVYAAEFNFVFVDVFIKTPHRKAAVSEILGL